MSYSIRGRFRLTDETEIMALLSRFPLIKPPDMKYALDKRSENEALIFIFEVSLKEESDKTSLFNALKPFVDTYGESIDWHECSHDEEISLPCEIAEIYTKG